MSNKMLAALNRQKYYDPSPIQLRSIPKALKGETLMVQSSTGSGKTLCFLIPIVEKIDLKNQNVQAIIVAPTRELAQQIYNFAVPFTKEFEGLKIRLLKAGEELESSLQGLKIAPHIVIGTPGRLKDVLAVEHALALNNVKTVVFDEADMLLKEGYFDDIDTFALQINSPQYLVFSATLEANLAARLEKYVGPNIPIVNEEVMTSSNVTHYLIDIKHEDINEAVEQFISIVNPYLLLVFASKKETANNIYAFLKRKKYKVGLLTGDLSSRGRKIVMRSLANDDIYILVCSDMAARGLDIPNVSDVLNVDLPNNSEFYYHRAGRTGRFDKKGNCYTFYNNDSTRKPLALVEQGVKFEYRVLKGNELIIGKPIEKSHPTKKHLDEELNKEIRKINNLAKASNKKVKPGYKKKTRLAVEKAKQKHRREIIKKDIRRQRVERYKKENRNG